MFLQYYVPTAVCWTDFMVLVCQNWGFFLYFFPLDFFRPGRLQRLCMRLYTCICRVYFLQFYVRI